MTLFITNSSRIFKSKASKFRRGTVYNRNPFPSLSLAFPECGIEFSIPLRVTTKWEHFSMIDVK